MGIYVKFTKTTHQIWSCHVTLASNSENFYFLPNSILKFRKVTKFGGNYLKNKNVTGKEPTGGGKAPSANRVKIFNAAGRLLFSFYSSVDNALIQSRLFQLFTICSDWNCHNFLEEF